MRKLTLPAISVEAFCGVSNTSLFEDISEGDTVLDLGCGAGLNTLIASGRTGAQGKVIAIDFSPSMLTPDGAVYAAELVLTAPLAAADRRSAANWFS